MITTLVVWTDIYGPGTDLQWLYCQMHNLLTFRLSTFSPIKWFMLGAFLASICVFLVSNFQISETQENCDIGLCTPYKVRRNSETKGE